MEDFNIQQWIVIPLLIFLARLLDVSIATIRIILVMNGIRSIAPVLGFIEALIWLIAIGQVMQNLTHSFSYIAYAGGFAAGTYVGMLMEEKLAMGVMLVRIITKKSAKDLISYLREHNFGTTCLDAQGSTGKVNVVYIVLKRTDLTRVVAAIQEFNPNAFYSIENIRFVSQGVFPEQYPYRRRFFDFFKRIQRK